MGEPMTPPGQRYAAYRAAQLEAGTAYQDFIVDLLATSKVLLIQQYASRQYQVAVGESRTGVEIKYQPAYNNTGNLWIETAEKARQRPGEYAKSGIYRSDNTWLWVTGTYDRVWVFPKRTLLLLAGDSRHPIRENKTQTSMGYLLTKKEADWYSSIILEPNASELVAKRFADLDSFTAEALRDLRGHPGQMDLFDREAT